jgi:hypothetical protein
MFYREASLVNDSEEAQKRALFALKEFTDLVENKESLSLQNIQRNRLSGFYEVYL